MFDEELHLKYRIIASQNIGSVIKKAVNASKQFKNV